jgi:hypothetical protein
MLDTLREPLVPPKIIILVYTTQDKVRRYLTSDFGDTVHVKVIRPNNTSSEIDETIFTAIGHERVFAIPELLAAGNSVLYLDNDTLVIPGIWKSLTRQQRPKCYAHESWQTMDTWLKRIKKSESVLKSFPFVAKHLQKCIINNGVQYYPRQSQLSHQIAKKTRELYNSMDSCCGYSYGFDQVAYSLAMYEILPDVATFYDPDTGCEDIWHAYQSKRKYCINLNFIGLVFIPESGSNIKQVFDIYNKLRQDCIDTGVMNSYNTVNESIYH